jgi:hypothetical protein
MAKLFKLLELTLEHPWMQKCVIKPFQLRLGWQVSLDGTTVFASPFLVPKNEANYQSTSKKKSKQTNRFKQCYHKVFHIFFLVSNESFSFLMLVRTKK